MVNLWIPKSSLPNSFYYTLNCLDSVLTNKKEMFFRKYGDGEVGYRVLKSRGIVL